ncbi:hypothetical protein C6P46_006831 [Rhodotorula mucilaginosa]|uniref:Uncharacterized protein n=1 Tax=Rhodotorula mucilaginosa TaxID=5537 RepID=A0A9P6W7Y7_RHOMI|nr:hypothetical protein C6P46_006831 [Rhodotorula mucilaginosa]TKA53188.1 hypothetical protein B0A53_04044 [Rhodotorula sp. CCFEE 5036]
MPRGHPLSTLRLKSSKTTILIPVNASTTLSELRSALLGALQATASSAPADDPELNGGSGDLPSNADDIALWRLEPSNKDAEGNMAAAEGNEAEHWVRLQDEKTGAAKWGVNEADEIAFSFKAADGSFPEPTVVRPVDDYDEQ